MYMCQMRILSNIRSARFVSNNLNDNYGQTANEDPRKSEFESKGILNLEGGLS